MEKSFDAALQSLASAIVRLEQAHVFFAQVSEKHEPETISFQMAQAGFIHHFAFTFTLASNVIQRWLKEYGLKRNELDIPLSRKDIFRIAARENILVHPEHWFSYADAHHSTSHTYNSQTADFVAQQGSLFLADVRVLLERCRKHNAT